MPTEVVDPSPAAWATGLGRRALAGGLTGASGLIISLVAGFLMTPYILGRIGPAAYGLFILVSSLVAYGGMLDLGVGGAVVKLVAEFRARRQLEEAGVLVATVVRVYMVLALSCIGITLAAAVLVPSIFNIPPSDAGTASLIVILMGSNLALAIFSTPTVSILVGLQRYDVHNVIGTMGVLLSAIGTVIVLALGGGVVGMVALGIPMTICMRLAGAWYIRRVAPEVALRWHGASRAMTRRVASLSAAIFATQVSAPLQKQTDEIVIGAFLTISSITPYALARKLSESAFQVTNQFVRVLLPIASGYDPVADIARLRELYVASTRATVAIFLSMAVALIVYGDLILSVWVGPDYSGAAPLVVILVAANLALVSAYPAGAILQGMGRFRVIAVSSLASGLFNLALSIMLVQWIGVTGVALGTLIPTVIEALAVVMPYTMRVLMVTPQTVVIRVWLPTLAPAALSAAVLLSLRTIFDLTSLLALLVASAFGVLVYFGSYFAFRVTAPERTSALDMVTHVVRRAARLRVER